MKTSESVAKISIALLKAQKAITFAVKDSKNDHFKNRYADLASVIEAIKAPLNDNGIVFLQSQSPSEHGFLAITTRLLHESAEWIEDTATVPLQKSDPQGYGSANTYARRYALAAITGLYQDDDDGNAASGLPAKPVQQKKEQSLSDDMFDDFLTKIQEASEADDLKLLFSDAWKKASKDQQTVIKSAYDARKKTLGVA